jgi:hypothetical protein
MAEKLKFVELSGHNGNLLALAALLGVNISTPCFAAHWLFELHCTGFSSTQWTIRAFYVPDPTQMTRDEYVSGLMPRLLPLDGNYVPYEDCTPDESPFGLTSANQLVDYLLSFVN